MFKGPDKDIEFIYTAPSSAVCGVSLDIGGKKEYLIAGEEEDTGGEAGVEPLAGGAGVASRGFPAFSHQRIPGTCVLANACQVHFH